MFFGYPHPEKRLWLNLEYMRLNKDKMVSLETTRQWMKFDDASRGPMLRSVHESIIETHAARYDKGWREYKGPSPSDSSYVEGLGNSGYRSSGYSSGGTSADDYSCSQ